MILDQCWHTRAAASLLWGIIVSLSFNREEYHHQNNFNAPLPKRSPCSQGIEISLREPSREGMPSRRGIAARLCWVWCPAPSDSFLTSIPFFCGSSLTLSRGQLLYLKIPLHFWNKSTRGYKIWFAICDKVGNLEFEPSFFIASSALWVHDFLTPTELGFFTLTSTMFKVFLGAAPKLRQVGAVSAFPSFVESSSRPDFLKRRTLFSEGAKEALTLDEGSLSLEVDDRASAAAVDLRDLRVIGLADISTTLRKTQLIWKSGRTVVKNWAFLKNWAIGQKKIGTWSILHHNICTAHSLAHAVDVYGLCLLCSLPFKNLWYAFLSPRYSRMCLKSASKTTFYLEREDSERRFWDDDYLRL